MWGRCMRVDGRKIELAKAWGPFRLYRVTVYKGGRDPTSHFEFWWRRGRRLFAIGDKGV
jgi:hypothetical protein